MYKHHIWNLFNCLETTTKLSTRSREFTMRKINLFVLVCVVLVVLAKKRRRKFRNLERMYYNAQRACKNDKYCMFCDCNEYQCTATEPERKLYKCYSNFFIPRKELRKTPTVSKIKASGTLRTFIPFWRKDCLDCPWNKVPEVRQKHKGNGVSVLNGRRSARNCTSKIVTDCRSALKQKQRRTTAKKYNPYFGGLTTPRYGNGATQSIMSQYRAALQAARLENNNCNTQLGQCQGQTPCCQTYV